MAKNQKLIFFELQGREMMQTRSWLDLPNTV